MNCPYDAILTYCSRKKSHAKKLLPAGQRYRSKRIRIVEEAARRLELPLYFLSAKCGLIGAHEFIHDYDKRLTSGAHLSRFAAEVGKAAYYHNIRHVLMIADPVDEGALPYLAVMARACLLSDAMLTVASIESLSWIAQMPLADLT